MLDHHHSEPTSPPRVVVLGAHGFLGRLVCADLADAGIPALALGREEVDLAQGQAGERLAAHLVEGDTLVFLSALTPDKGRDSATLMTNLAMARAVGAAAGRVKLGHLVYASSDAVYPFAGGLVSEETAAAPGDLYGAMHRTREILLAAEAPSPLGILRFTAVYGAGDTHNSYGPNRFARQALKDGVIRLFGEGEETRDHLYGADAAAILRRVVQHRSSGLLNVASGQSMCFRDVAEAVAARVPGTRLEASPRQSPVTHRHFEPTAMLTAFPDVRFTPFGQALDATLAGLRASHG